MTPLEAGVSSEDIHRLSGMIGQMSRDIYRIVGAYGAMAARATTFARLTVRIENLAYKAWLLHGPIRGKALRWWNIPR